MRKLFWVVVLVALLLPFLPGQIAQAAPTGPLFFDGHGVASCGVQPNEVDLGMVNLMKDSRSLFAVAGIWAQPDGGVPEQITAFPEGVREVKPGQWATVGERLENRFDDFKGLVWARMDVYTDVAATSDSYIGMLEIKPTRLDCTGAGMKPVELGYHYVAACDEQPDEVDLKLQNLNPVNVFVDGQIFMFTPSGVRKQISYVPEPYRLIKPGDWGGPGQRIREETLEPGTFLVDGWAQMTSLEDTPMGRMEMGPVALVCNEAVTPDATATPTSTPTVTATPTATSTPTSTARGHFTFLPVTWRTNPTPTPTSTPKPTLQCPPIKHQSGFRPVDGGISPGVGVQNALRFWIENDGQFDIVTWSVTEKRLDGSVRNILHEDVVCTVVECSTSLIFGSEAEPKPFPGAQLDVTFQGYPERAGSNCGKLVYADPPPGSPEWFALFFATNK